MNAFIGNDFVHTMQSSKSYYTSEPDAFAMKNLYRYATFYDARDVTSNRGVLPPQLKVKVPPRLSRHKKVIQRRVLNVLNPFK